MSCKLYSISSDEELPVVCVFNAATEIHYNYGQNEAR